LLLKALYDYAQTHHLLDDQAFEERPVRWMIDLNADGSLSGSGPIDLSSPEEKRGRIFSCPVTGRSKNAGGVAEFLVDGLTALFGEDPGGPGPASDGDESEKEKKARQKRAKNNQDKLADFWEQIRAAHRKCPSQSTKALLAFHDRHAAPGEGPSKLTVPFLRWGAAKGSPQPAPQGRKGKAAKLEPSGKWWVTTASGADVALGNGDTFTFSVDGHVVLEDEELRAFWREAAGTERSERQAGARRGLCLVTGSSDAPVAATQGKVSGVPGTVAMGANLVSFDKAAFTSFGFDQGDNATVSIEAASAYSAALNDILAKPDRHLRMGKGLVAVFWNEGGELDLLQLLDRPDELSVKQLLSSPWKGIERAAIDSASLISATLAGNAGRIAVRSWLREPLEQAVGNLQKWFRDLELEAMPEPPTRKKKAAAAKSFCPLSLYWLARSTVRDEKDLMPEVSLQLYRAALEGHAPSTSLSAQALRRLRAEIGKEGSGAILRSPSRFALLKLVHNRNQKEGGFMIEPKLADTDDAAYNCGRLLAVLQGLQAVAHEYKLEGAGVVERYYGTASTAPATVFPLLLRLARHHLHKLSRAGEKQGRAAGKIEERIGEVLSRFSSGAGQAPAFPTLLDMAAQGRFALGFYQQKVEDERRKAEATAASKKQAAEA